MLTFISRARHLAWSGVLACSIPVAAGAQGPPARNSHAMATGPEGRVVLLGGGASSAPRLVDTLWSWSGTAWQALADDGPRNRNLPAAAWDSRRRVLVVYGGAAGASGTRFGDTWEWNGTRWTELNVRTPGPRDHHAMAYDSARGQVVMYGGRVGTALVGGTWTWDGRTWRMADSVTGPGPLAHHAMAYDSRRQRVVMHGGLPPEGPRHDGTWEWDGTRWERITTTGGPGARSHHRMAYDPSRGVTVLFGGGDSTAAETWTYDGRAWTRHDHTGPQPRWSAAMAWDASRGRVVLFGGGQGRRPFASLGDTWEWDGERWTEVTPASVLPSPLHGEMPSVRVQEPAFVALSVPDLDASIRWYGDLFGLTVQTRFGDGPVRGVILAGSGLTIELIDDERVVTRPAAGPQDPPAHGVFKAMLYVDSLSAVLNVLRTRGIQLVGHWPQSQPPNLMIRDPDGNLLQFTEHRR